MKLSSLVLLKSSLSGDISKHQINLFYTLVLASEFFKPYDRYHRFNNLVYDVCASVYRQVTYPTHGKMALFDGRFEYNGKYTV